MIKFIRVTEQACGEVRLIPTSSIKEVSVDGNGSVVFDGEGRFFAKESIEQIETQLLRDEFAKAALVSASVEENLLPYDLAAWAYKTADEMIKERSK